MKKSKKTIVCCGIIIMNAADFEGPLALITFQPFGGQVEG